MRAPALLLLLLFLPCATPAQELDSLWRMWQDTALPDSVRVRALNHYSWKKYLYTEPDSAEYYAQIMYDFAEEHGLVKWMAWALRGQGVSYKIRGANAKALDCWLRSERMSRSVNDLGGVAGSLNNIGILYNELGDLPHALDYHKQSLAIRQQCRDTIGEGASLTSIGDIYRLQGRMDSALLYLQRGLQHNERIAYRAGVGIAHLRSGDAYRDLGQPAEALTHFTLALRILRGENAAIFTAECLTRLGLLHLASGRYAAAIMRCEQALSLADSTQNMAGQKQACDCLYAAYRRIEQREMALYHLERSKRIGDSLRSAEVGMDLQFMEFNKQLYSDSTLQAERELRKATVVDAILERERMRRNIVLVASVGILLLALGLWSRLRYINRTSAIIKAEKERSDDLLLNILPAEVARELKEHGASQARHIEQATILFSDFKGFTELSEKLDATTLVAEIDACFEAFDNIMERHGVEKIKTIGDAYMAAGGLVPDPASVRNTVLAALEMQQFIAQRQRHHEREGKPAFEMRVGIHTGPVVAGIVGVKKFQYDIWGDTVNIASRMESCGAVGQVNISEATYALVKGSTPLHASTPLSDSTPLSEGAAFTFTPRGKVQAKGKGEMEMYFVALA